MIKEIAMKCLHFPRIILLLIAFQLPCITSVSAAEDTYKLIVFGDSLVDIGNDLSESFLITTPDGTVIPGLVVPPPTRYDRGHFSNGPVISDYLAQKFKVTITPSTQGANLHTDSICYGYGGSETGISNLTGGLMPVPGLRGQVDIYLTEVEANNISLDDTVFFMLAGANDYQSSLALGEEPDPFMIVNNIVEAATALTYQGAELIVVSNLPDLGQTPFCNIFGICNILSQLTLAHNDILAQRIAALNSMTASKVVVFDAYTLFNKIINDPTKFDIPQEFGEGPASGCLFQPATSFLLSNCTAVPFKSTGIFWDEMHPVTEVHKIFAKEIWKKSMKKNLRD